MNARFFIFTGVKGGSGTSTVCVETAKALAAQNSVELIDADLEGHRSAAILLNCIRALDASRDANGQIAVARASGITVAEFAPSYGAGFMLSAGSVETFSFEMQPQTIVLVDAPLPLSSSIRPLVVRGTRFILVLEPTLLGIAAAHTMIENYESFGIPRSRMLLAINARNVDRTASRSDIESALGVKVATDVPSLSDRSFQKNINAFALSLTGIPPEDTLQGLQPSSNGIIRDRRSQPREVPKLVAVKRDYVPSDRERIKARVHEALTKDVDLLDASRAQGDSAKLSELRLEIERIAQTVLTEDAFNLSAEDIGRIKQEVVNEALGLGPLEELMDDPDITEIMVNGPNEIYIERQGVIHSTERRFDSEKQLRLIIERIITPLGRRIDEASPMVDARLPDGSRVNAIIEPLSLDGATLTIRRFGTRRLTTTDLLEKHSVCQQMLDFLRACVESRLNVVISGGTGSGKTTFLNILSGYLPDNERIITIEDAAELLLNQPHVVRLESRPANIEGQGEVRIRDLVRNALRMRPDRIVVGECRGAEALDMLQAMNTGHDGSLTTIHANSARDALSRIETMVLMAGFDLPIRAIREQIAAAFDVVIQTARLRDGTRKVIGISEVVGMEGDVVTMQEIVRFTQHGINEDRRVIGQFEYTGVQPKALSRFEEYGVPFDTRILSALPLSMSLW